MVDVVGDLMDGGEPFGFLAAPVARPHRYSPAIGFGLPGQTHGLVTFYRSYSRFRRPKPQAPATCPPRTSRQIRSSRSSFRGQDPRRQWSFQPTKDVRTVAQLFAHIADGQYEFCGVAAEGKSVSKDIEKTLKTKAEIKEVNRRPR